MQGRGVNPSLNEEGKDQARQFYNYYCNESFEIIYTSTLRRSYESVQLFIQKGIPWEEHAELDEVSWGIFEGQPVTPALNCFIEKLQDDWREESLDAKAEGGESPVEVSLRQKQFIKYLISKPEEKILICMMVDDENVYCKSFKSGSYDDGSVSSFQSHALQTLFLTAGVFPLHFLTTEIIYRKC